MGLCYILCIKNAPEEREYVSLFACICVDRKCRTLPAPGKGNREIGVGWRIFNEPAYFLYLYFLNHVQVLPVQNIESHTSEVTLSLSSFQEVGATGGS